MELLLHSLFLQHMLQIGIAHSTNALGIKNIIEACQLGAVHSCVEDGLCLLNILQAAKTLPNILFVDVYLPTIDGALVTKIIKLKHPNIKIVGIHTADDDITIATMLFAGADGYVWQYDLGSIIPHCIQHIDHDPVYLDSRLGLVRLYQLYQRRCQYLCKCAEVIAQYKLTPAEQKFLALSASQLPYHTIAMLLHVTTKTLHTYFYRITQKLPVTNRQELTVFSLQYGLSIITNHITKEMAMLNA